MCCVFLRLLFTPCIFLTLLTFSCLTEKWGYLGWWGSSAHPAAPIIQSWLCNPVELQKRNPNAPGDCEVSTYRFIVESLFTEWQVICGVTGEWRFCFPISSAETKMKCRRFTRLSCRLLSLAWKWTQNLMAAGTTEVGSPPVCLDRTGPGSWLCVIAAWAWMTATVSGRKK